MPEPRLGHRSFIWSSRTLAVISCALALLVTQPAASGASAHARSRTVALRDAGGSAGRVDHSTPHVTPRDARRATLDRHEESFFDTARRFHILATVEILHRLLISELQPCERQILPALCFDPICVGMVQLPTTRSGGAWIEADTGPRVTVERDFAIGHCLLAPPNS
jgi:hypothetical protein